MIIRNIGHYGILTSVRGVLQIITTDHIKLFNTIIMIIILIFYSEKILIILRIHIHVFHHSYKGSTISFLWGARSCFRSWISPQNLQEWFPYFLHYRVLDFVFYFLYKQISALSHPNIFSPYFWAWIFFYGNPLSPSHKTNGCSLNSLYLWHSTHFFVLLIFSNFVFSLCWLTI